jgi:WhiB family transcriptional regulator, redox-sensing transcriptional regulator
MLAEAQEARGIEALLIEARSDFDWAQAGCRDGTANLVDLFFSEQLDDIARAKAICAGCPLADPCLAGALDRSEPWGVWGGQLFANGRILPFKRKRGRPPKNPQAQMTA